VNSPVVKKCRRIHYELLSQADPELFQFLEDMDMEPQLYVLRWVRLLLGREFHLEDALLLWDAIFAYGEDLALLDYIIVAMLIYIRQSLIGKENSLCLQRLFNYPPVEDVFLFVEKALAIKHPEPIDFLQSSARASATHPDEKAEKVASPSEHETEFLALLQTVSAQPSAPSVNPVSNLLFTQSTKKTGSTLGSTFKSLLAVPPPRKVLQTDQLTRQLQQLQQTQTHMANRLERIIYTLQTQLANEDGAKEESKEAKLERIDAMLLALAELKQVRDTLLGLLPPDDKILPDDFADPLGAKSL